jgi:hypothetical protein
MNKIISSAIAVSAITVSTFFGLTLVNVNSSKADLESKREIAQSLGQSGQLPQTVVLQLDTKSLRNLTCEITTIPGNPNSYSSKRYDRQVFTCNSTNR